MTLPTPTRTVLEIQGIEPALRSVLADELNDTLQQPSFLTRVIVKKKDTTTLMVISNLGLIVEFMIYDYVYHVQCLSPCCGHRSRSFSDNSAFCECGKQFYSLRNGQRVNVNDDESLDIFQDELVKIVDAQTSDYLTSLFVASEIRALLNGLAEHL